MGSWKHRLLTKNLDSGTGVCQECGTVDLAISSSGRVRCLTGKRQQDLAAYHSRDLQENNAKRLRYKRKSYGLTEEDLDVMENAERCEGCGTTEDLCADHNHKSLKFRGCLCRSCNAILGLAKDSPIVLRTLANYVEDRL